MTNKYTLEYLNSLLIKDNSKLTGNYKILKKRMPITFICN